MIRHCHAQHQSKSARAGGGGPVGRPGPVSGRALLGQHCVRHSVYSSPACGSVRSATAPPGNSASTIKSQHSLHATSASRQRAISPASRLQETPPTEFPPHRTVSGSGCSCTPPCRRAAPCSSAPWQTAPGRAHRPRAATAPSCAAPASSTGTPPAARSADTSSCGSAAPSFSSKKSRSSILHLAGPRTSAAFGPLCHPASHGPRMGKSKA